MYTLNWKDWPLAVKLPLMVMFMVIITVISVTWLSIYREHNTFRTELEQQATLLIDTLEAVIEDPLYYMDFDQLSDIMEAMGIEREILVFGRIYDSEGRIAADSYEEQLSYTTEIDPFGKFLLENPATVFEWQSDRLIAGRAVTAGPQKLGAVSIGLSTAQLEIKLAATRLQSLFVALIASIVGLLLALLLSHTITEPLQKLVTATDHISRGDLTQKIAAHRKDEVGRLGNAMERMRSELQQFHLKMEQLVTARTQALQESEVRFRQVVTSISDHIYMAELGKDRSWTTRYLSPKVETLTGYPLEKFLGESGFWRTLIHPDDKTVVATHVANIIEGQHSEVEYRLIRDDDSIIWVRDSGQVAKHGAQDKIVVYGVVSDITERKQAEIEQLRLEVQLQQSQKLETIGKLAGGVAHEFNNILAILLGALELLMDELPENGAAQKRLEQIYQTGERGKELVKEILIFSRSSYQERQLVPLAPILRKIIASLRPTLPSNVKLHHYLGPNCPPVLTNTLNIEQIVINLCKNAVQAMDTKQGTVEIRLDDINYSSSPAHFPGLPEGRYARIIVSDTGSGMSPDVKRHIFDPFFTTKKAGTGTGLGLSIVHRIIEQDRGRITVESEPGKGTTFEILLPVVQDMLELGVPVEKSFEQGQEERQKLLEKQHILLVANDPKGLRLPLMALEKLGYTITVVYKGSEALRRFRTDPQQFDLVLTDLTMPEMNGIELCREFVRIRPGIPLILCIEANETAETKTAEEAGIVNFLQKPLKVRVLTQTLREMLEVSQAYESLSGNFG